MPTRHRYTHTSRTLSIAVAMALTGGGFQALPVLAQPGQEGEGPALEEIMVTGSRIQRSSFTTPTPVTALSADQLSDMAPGNLIEAFDQIPQFLNNESPTTQFNFAGAAGASNLNLRGIGSNRTLVLLDGRRMVSANRLGTVDINLFPEAMIERVEVVTGGASAAYGSDAVAGVTNFILDSDFTGVSTHAQGGVTDRGDAESGEASFSFGTDLAQDFHLIASAEYFEQNGIEAYPDRDWYQGWGTVTNPAWLQSGGEQLPRLLIAPRVVSTQYTFGGLINQPGSALDRQMFTPQGEATPFILNELSVVGTGTQSQTTVGGGSGDNVEADRGGQGGLVPDIQRGAAFAYLDYDFSPNLTGYVQAIYGNSQTNGVGNSPVFFGPWQGRIFAENAFLPQNVRDIMTAEGLQSFGFSRMHSTADLAQGRMEQRNTTMSYTAGFEYEMLGGLFDGWQVNGYYQYGKNENEIDLIDFIRTDRLSLAMDAVVDPATGEVVCNVTRFPGNERWSGCVPLNLLGEGRASPAAIDYVLGPDKTIDADIRQRFAEIAANGEIWQGWGAGPVSGAIGASYREDSLDQRVGPPGLFALSTPRNDPSRGIRGIPPGFAGDEEVFQFSGVQPIAGSYQVREYFGELLVPLVSGMTGAEQLDLSLAARWADYSGSGGIWSYKAGIDWQLVPDLRLRGTYSRDIRAANLSERFDQQGQGASAEDPLFNDESYAFAQTIGGNPAVDPEEADTITFGLVYQPSYLADFSLALDYYEIDIAGAIGQLGVQRIIDDCFRGAEDLCARITRDQETNRILNVENIFLNINKARVSGVDLEASYSMDVDWLPGEAFESFNLRFLGSYLKENSTTNIGAPPQDQAGEIGGGLGAGLPEYKWSLGATYINGPFRGYLQQRYVGEGTLDNEWVEGVDIIDNTVDNAWYTDLRLGYDFEMGTNGTLQVFGNVTNLFDEDPPIAAGFFSFFGATQANESLHDVLGRRYTAGLRYDY